MHEGHKGVGGTRFEPATAKVSQPLTVNAPPVTSLSHAQAVARGMVCLRNDCWYDPIKGSLFCDECTGWYRNIGDPGSVVGVMTAKQENPSLALDIPTVEQQLEAMRHAVALGNC